MHSKISTCFYSVLFKYKFGFKQGYSSKQHLLVLTEKLKKSLDKGVKYGALLTKLSKAFDCLLHDLLIANLPAFGLDADSLRMIHSYPAGRKQRVKIVTNTSHGKRTFWGTSRFNTGSTTFQYSHV